MNKKRIAVIGAGIAGLTCAYELQKKGYEVEVFEKEGYVGGRMSTRTKNHFAMDIGANHLANVYTHMRRLASELGLEWKPMEFLNYRIVKDGKVVPLLSGLSKKTLRRMAWHGFWDTHKKTDFFDLSSAVKYDTCSAADYAKKKFGEEGYGYVADPFVSVYQFHRSDEISMGAALAMTRSHYKEKEEWNLHHLKGGMIALPQALASHLSTHLATPVRRVLPTENGVFVDTAEGTKLFHAVVLATTATVAKEIYPSATEGQKKVLEGTRYAATVGLAFQVPKGLLKDTTIVWVPYAESQTISGYTNEAMKGNELIHDGKTLLITWFHEEFAKTLMDKSDEEIYAIGAEELTKVCPFITNLSLLQPHDVERWKEAMPVFRTGHLRMVKEFLDHHQGENNIFFAGDYLNAPWTEGALRCGERVADKIARKIL